ncbi:MLXPL protein, partial [Amia calva]|nr:MLXPL protein [Amia calva]
MSLAFSGKIVSPKWKSFKGLRLLWRDKIRLNNGIWRAWYIQYVEKRKNPVCGFVTPLEGSEADAHRKPEAIVLEGSYWKRRIEVVIKEYHKWRIYHKKRLQKNKDGQLSVLEKGNVYQEGVKKWPNQMFQEPVPMQEEAHMFDLDCFLSDISDTLFTMTQKPCHWGADWHNTYTSNADMIQPGLTPLQPNLDDFMDIPDIFMSYRGQSLEQAGFADCGYFGGMSGSVFSPGPASMTAGTLMPGESQLAQANAVLGNASRLSVPSSSDAHSDSIYHRQSLPPGMAYNHSGMTSDPKHKTEVDYSHQSEYHRSDLVPVTTPYGHEHYTSSTALTHPNMSALAQDSPFTPYSTPGHKYGYNSSVTSSVITHTGLTSTLIPQEHTGHGYAAPEVYSPAPCASLGYPSPFNTQSGLPPVTMPHNFSVPQGSGMKYKQKTASVKSKRSVLTSSSPMQTSCLAKLLSTSTPERKSTLSFDPPGVEARTHLSTSPTSPSSGGVHFSCGTSMVETTAQKSHSPSQSAGIPMLTPLHCQTMIIPDGSQSTSSTHGSAVSALLTQNTMSMSSPLLVPKSEKLSPVQTFNEKTSLTVSFRRNSDQLSPTHPSEKSPSPQSPHSNPTQVRPEHTKVETRRITHISAEQKRRFNIKLGFDTLHGLVTTLSSQPSIKISKATTLQKTAEYIGKMQQERAQLHDEAQRLRVEIVALNSAINVCQQQLPATGVPITRQRFDHMREMFRDYVRAQTLQNWKFWIFSIIIEPLFESYNGMVSTASVEDLCRTTLSWLDQHCSLPALRPTVLSSLRHLSTSTSILTDPTLVPEQATQAVTQSNPSNTYSPQPQAFS